MGVQTPNPSAKKESFQRIEIIGNGDFGDRSNVPMSRGLELNKKKNVKCCPRDLKPGSLAEIRY